MTRHYIEPRPDLYRVALIRDETDRLVRLPENRNRGLGACRGVAVVLVSKALGGERGEGGR